MSKKNIKHKQNFSKKINENSHQKINYKLNYNFRKYLILPFKIFKMAIYDTIRHDGIEHAGYLAFLSILSLFPSLIFLISIIGLVGATDIGIDSINKILSSLPKEMSHALSPRINEIVMGPKNSYLTIAIIGVIWTASSSVEGCRTILNRAYRVAFPPPYLWRRIFSIMEFFIIVFTVISAIMAFVIIPSTLKDLEAKFNFALNIDYDFFYLRYIAFLLLLISATSLLYYALPNAKQKITQTVPGSILAVFFWIILEHLLSYYLDRFHQVNFVYGSIAGIIISLMFFYLISLVFILGAEFNYHFHRTYQVFLKNNKK
jgi:membrane protein